MTTVRSEHSRQDGSEASESPTKEEALSWEDLTQALSDVGHILRIRQQISDILRRILHRTLEGSLYSDVLDTVFSSLRLAIPCDRMGIALLDEDRETLRLSWVKSSVPLLHLQRDYSARIAGSSIESIFRDGRPRIINDLEEYADAHPQSESTRLILKDGIHSSLTLPLVANAVPIGVVFFSSCEKNTYQEKHVQIFSEISEILSLIVEQGRLRQFFDQTRSKDRMISMFLHDLRSPLGIIKGFIDMMPIESWYPSLDESAKESFDILRRNSESMMELIDDLSQINLGLQTEMTIESRPVDLRTFASDFCSEAEICAGHKRISFIGDLDRYLPRVANFDPCRIRQVLMNLLTNAVKFSYPHTKIIFEVLSEPKKLFFSLLDQGQGIPADELPKLFQWMGRTSTRPTEGEKSTGMGLSISRRIIEKHGGEILAESWLHVGSKFSFWIPLDESGQIH